jgi:flagellar biosynthesis repressor protein FlbT
MAMAGLRLKLRPHERVLINGAVIENGASQVELRVVSPDTRILRLRDALHPEAVHTPTERVCYIAQLLVAGEAGAEEAVPQFVRGVAALKQVFLDPGSQAVMDQALRFVHAGNYYKAMQCMRRILAYERLVLENPAYAKRGGKEPEEPHVRSVRRNLSPVPPAPA